MTENARTTSLWRRAAASVIAGLLGGACATHRHAEAPQAPEPAARGSLHGYISEVRTATAAARPRPEQALLLEQSDPALKELRTQLLAAPTALNHQRVAEGYASRGVRDAAYDHFTAALKLSPKDPAVLAGRARVWRDWGQPRLGLADAHRAVFHAPGSTDAINTLGTILLKLGLPAEAGAAFERALALDPHAAYAFNNLCYVRLLQGHHQQAIGLCTSALSIAPDLSAARNNLALAYAASGDFESASQAFAKSSSSGAASFNMGIAFLATGRFTDAAAAFERSAELRPSSSEARRRASAARARAARPSSTRAGVPLRSEFP